MKKYFFSMSFAPLFLMQSLGVDLSHPVKVQPYNMQQYNQEINTIYQNNMVNSSNSPNRNITRLGQYFLGRPYAIYSIGEGFNGKFDQNPAYRTDVFDCETFVMTVAALSLAHDLSSFKQTFFALNYANGSPNFFKRNHFVEVQWNINNQQKGLIKDITKSISPLVISLPIKINVNTWFAQLPAGRIQLLTPISVPETKSLLYTLHHASQTSAVLKTHLTIIPTAAFLSPTTGPDILAKIPDGTVIEIVKPLKISNDVYLTPYYISHMGFAIHKNGQLYMLEASFPDKKVELIPFIYFLTHNNVFGINLEQVKLPTSQQE